MAEPKLKGKKWTIEDEIKITEEWKKNKEYKFNKDSKKEVFSIDTPPPYVNMPIHIGHATVYTMQDMIARYKRMKGYNVLNPLGLDRNGLPIEVAAEKKYGVKLTELTREKAIYYCKKVLEDSSNLSINSFIRLGISFNSFEVGNNIGDAYFTDSDLYRTLTQETFIDLWKKGLIYEDERINNWDPLLQTTIADSEIEYKEIESDFNDIVFKCKETNEELIIGTTRPELISSCGMVIYNPEDERYKHLEGKTAILPLYNKEVPIKAHPMAKKDKGTGLVMMCSAGDLSDIRFFREQGLKPIISINQDGTMNKNAGPLEGLKVREARKKIIELLDKENLFRGKRKVLHRVPISDRSGAEIEFISMKEYYLKQVDFLEELKKIENKLKFFAPQSKKIFDDWVNSVSIDWPISRRRYYGTEIPVWHCNNCGYIYVPEKGKYYKPWKEPCPLKECPKCKSKDWKGETKIFDTWFDSASSPLHILGYRTDKEFFAKNKPCSLRPQGKEIVRTWLYYTLLKEYLLLGEPIFKHVWIHNHVVDSKGYKMSKRKGNGIDPLEILDKYGTEPFRLWAVTEGNIIYDDLRCSFDRIEGAGKTIIKLWNVARFISSFEQSSNEYDLREIDKWIISEIDNLCEFSDKSYNNYDFHVPAIQIKHFLWDTLSSHYLEIAKKRIYDNKNQFSEKEKNAAVFTLNYVLRKLLKLWAPVIPIITYKIYKDLYHEKIHSLEFPKVEKKTKSKITTKDIEEINAFVWKFKKDNNMSLKSPIEELYLQEKYKPIIKDLKALHEINKIEFGELKVKK